LPTVKIFVLPRHKTVCGSPAVVVALAVRYEKESHAGPSLELETPPAPIFVEAEGGQLTTPMRALLEKDAAGGVSVFAPPGAGRGENGGKVLDNGRATYKISIPKDGTYRLNARVFWKSTSNNSFFYAWDGGKPQILGNDENFGKWHWIQTEPTHLKAGEHTLVIRNREENSVLDCMTLTPDVRP
jgi:hypothetical protein